MAGRLRSWRMRAMGAYAAALEDDVVFVDADAELADDDAVEAGVDFAFFSKNVTCTDAETAPDPELLDTREARLTELSLMATESMLHG